MYARAQAVHGVDEDYDEAVGQQDDEGAEAMRGK